MEDVDKIIISSIKGLGCTGIDDNQSLKQCTVEQVIEMTVCCLKAINPGIKLSSVLPNSISARFNMCAKLAQICTDLGYRGEVGFHTFLYCNESDIRKVMMFLVENLPRDDVKDSSDDTPSHALTLRQNVGETLKSSYLLDANDDNFIPVLNKPFVSKYMETGTLIPGQKIDCTTKEWKNFVINKLPYITEQTSNYLNFLPSIITLNSRGILHPLQMKHSQWNNSDHDIDIMLQECPNFDTLDNIELFPKNTSGNIESSCRTHITSFKDKNSDLASQKDTLLTGSSSEPLNDTSSHTDISTELENIEKHVSELNYRLSEVTKIYSSKKENSYVRKKQNDFAFYSVQLLPDVEENIEKLQTLNEKYRNKMKRLISQWEECQKPLLEKYDSMKECGNSILTNKLELLQKTATLRSSIQYIDERIKTKSVLEKKLTEYQSTIQGTPRNEYTERILEIIDNIKKQGKEIDKILSDTKVLQRELNTLTERVERSFITVDKRICESSCEDEFSCEAYELLGSIHKDCSDIVQMVTEMGLTTREIKDLEEQVVELSATVTTESIQQVAADIKKIKAEQEYLNQQLHNVIGC